MHEPRLIFIYSTQTNLFVNDSRIREWDGSNVGCIVN